MSSNYICKDDFDNYLIICETQPAEKGQPSFAKGHNPERLLPEKLVQHQVDYQIDVSWWKRLINNSILDWI